MYNSQFYVVFGTNSLLTCKVRVILGSRVLYPLRQVIVPFDVVGWNTAKTSNHGLQASCNRNTRMQRCDTKDDCFW